jgi:hypothetical protein
MAQISTIQSILTELRRRKKPKQWLADEVADRIGQNRSRPNPKTILRMLRGDTQGGVYLIDQCLSVLELKLVRWTRQEKQNPPAA